MINWKGFSEVLDCPTSRISLLLKRYKPSLKFLSKCVFIGATSLYTCICMFLKVSVDVISLINDDELTSLGVQHMGDRVILRNICKNMKRMLWACIWLYQPCSPILFGICMH